MAKHKTVNGIPLEVPADERERQQIRRALDPLKKAIELEKTSIRHIRKKFRGDPNKKLEFSLYIFVIGYGLLLVSASKFVHIFI